MEIYTDYLITKEATDVDELGLIESLEKSLAGGRLFTSFLKILSNKEIIEVSGELPIIHAMNPKFLDYLVSKKLVTLSTELSEEHIKNGITKRGKYTLKIEGI